MFARDRRIRLVCAPLRPAAISLREADTLGTNRGRIGKWR